MDGYRDQRLRDVDEIDDNEELPALVFRDGHLVSEKIRLSGRAIEDIETNQALWVYS